MAQLRFGGLESQGNIVLAVSMTGSDTPSANRPARIVRGDYSAYPFATIQAAIDALPKQMRHQLIVNVGAGTFPGFLVEGFNFLTYNPQINGTRALFVPATGPSTGTATSGAVGTLTMVGAGWTADDLVGKFLVITAGAAAGTIVPIWKNTSDTIYVSFIDAYNATSVFRIEDVVTICNTAPIGGNYIDIVTFSGNPGIVWPIVQNIKATGSPYPASGGFVAFASTVIFQYCVAKSVPYGFFSQQSDISAPTYCAAIDVAYYGYFHTGAASYTYHQGCFAKSCGFAGLYLSGNTISLLYSFYGIGCATGLVAEDQSRVDCFIAPLILKDCGRSVWAIRSSITFGDCSIDGSTVRSFELDGGRVDVTGPLSGSGNAGFGLNAKGLGNVVGLAGSTPTITGTSGEVTVDGTTDHTWAALAAPGTYAVDTVTGARVVRQ